MSRRIIGALSDISHDRFRKSVRGAASNAHSKSRKQLRCTGKSKHMTAQTQQAPTREALIRLGERNGVELAVMPPLEKSAAAVILPPDSPALLVCGPTQHS